MAMSDHNTVSTTSFGCSSETCPGKDEWQGKKIMDTLKDLQQKGLASLSELEESLLRTVARDGALIAVTLCSITLVILIIGTAIYHWKHGTIHEEVLHEESERRKRKNHKKRVIVNNNIKDAQS
ncbi:hypothetical protein CHS0354_011835 [Potamilus streckersoni]|uniref:Uncharacterized protein n=1 Tax=Potamilus streckersoni TaxID=2493646 RepID=A0AAE0WC07_9BIVA|nr:hypothetical protein CHS0354_011835 [Potamilus streckersoni]